MTKTVLTDEDDIVKVQNRLAFFPDFFPDIFERKSLDAVRMQIGNWAEQHTRNFPFFATFSKNFFFFF